MTQAITLTEALNQGYNEDDTILITRLSKIRKTWSNEEKESLIGTEMWDSKGVIHIKFDRMSDDGMLYLTDIVTGRKYKATSFEERIKNKNLYSRRVKEFENGVPVECYD